MTISDTRQPTIWKRSLIVGVLTAAALIVILGAAAQTVGQNRTVTPANQDTVEVQANVESQGLIKDLSVWRILRMTDWLFWPFVALTVGGLMLLIFRSLVEVREKNRAQVLYAELDQLRDMRSLLEAIQKSAPNRAARLFRQTVFTFNKTGRAEPIRDDANQFLNGERDSFETFNRVLNFLSDTAGALGLLGTVWGIFATFHSGKLDGPTILQGMSISLVTTLVGLIISSVLNMGATAVFAVFNKQLNRLSSRAEEVRQALLNLEKRVQAQTTPARQPATAPQPDAAEYQPDPHVKVVETGGWPSGNGGNGPGPRQQVF